MTIEHFAFGPHAKNMFSKYHRIPNQTAPIKGDKYQQNTTQN